MAFVKPIIADSQIHDGFNEPIHGSINSIMFSVLPRIATKNPLMDYTYPILPLAPPKDGSLLYMLDFGNPSMEFCKSNNAFYKPNFGSTYPVMAFANPLLGYVNPMMCLQ